MMTSFAPNFDPPTSRHAERELIEERDARVGEQNAVPRR
jgi:hypothetical protein